MGLDDINHINEVSSASNHKFSKILLNTLHSKVHPSFLIRLMDFITKDYRLSTDPISIDATYQTARNGSEYSALKSFIEVDQDSIPSKWSLTLNENTNHVSDKSNEQNKSNEQDKSSTLTLDWIQNKAHGLMYIKHTQEDFKNENKSELLRHHAEKTFKAAVLDGSWVENPASSLNSFLILCWPELKNHYCWYWFSFVGIKTSKPIVGQKILNEGLNVKGESESDTINSSSDSSQIENWWENEEFYETYSLFRKSAHPNERSFFLIGDKTKIYSLRDWKQAYSSSSEVYLSFNDPSYKEDVPSWILRNFLIAATITFKKREFKILCIKEQPSLKSLHGSSLFIVQSPEEFLDKSSEDISFSFIGWEKNNKGRLVYKKGQIQKLTNEDMAEQSATLNVQLMKWRMAPELKDQDLSKTKCLLLGAGTLGSYVARCLLGWGMFNITFVDRAYVSYSNPVRQPLFEFDDCHEGGKPKAEAAAQALKRIYPKVNSKGISMDIPMPGHVYSNSEKDKVAKDVENLEKLIQEHDAIFLLMDSRESRWLPTLLGIYYDKIVINSALGFDSFVVMRHGSISNEDPDASRLGCYFCSDVVAPVNSMKDRTLDQMCTVTRPGLAGWAGMLAVELLVNLLHHPDHQRAPCTEPSDSLMGSVPHQIRGSLREFDLIKMQGKNYSQCIACSSIVLNEYKIRGMEFLHNCFLHPTSLEKLTGLDLLQQEAQELLEHDEVYSDDDFEII